MRRTSPLLNCALVIEVFCVSLILAFRFIAAVSLFRFTVSSSSVVCRVSRRFHHLVVAVYDAYPAVHLKVPPARHCSQLSSPSIFGAGRDGLRL